MHAADFLAHVVHRYFDRIRTRRRGLMVRNPLMNHPDQMRRARVVEGESEFARCVSFCMAHLLHAGGELDENGLVSSGWLAGSAIGDGAFQSGGEQRRCARDQKECHRAYLGPDCQTLCPFLRNVVFALCAPDSKREISARMAAASSSRELFIA
jgi:hypothetical protein